MVDVIEQAKEMFRKLEEGNPGHSAEIAKRAFYIQKILAKN